MTEAPMNESGLADALIEQRLYRTQYLVIPRLAMQAMPEWWQAEMERLLQAADDTGLETPGYIVLRKGEEYVHVKHEDSEDEYSRVEEYWPRMDDPWADYRRGIVTDLCPGFDVSKVTRTPAGEGGAVAIHIDCPECSAPHIDEGEWATRLHKTHQCQSCGHEWRPFPYATVGVTRPQASLTAGEVAAMLDKLIAAAIDFCEDAVPSSAVREAKAALLARLSPESVGEGGS